MSSWYVHCVGGWSASPEWRRSPDISPGAAMTLALELMLYASAFALGAVTLGPPMHYWSTLWEDKWHRHRTRCETCQCRAVARARRQAERHG